MTALPIIGENSSKPMSNKEIEEIYKGLIFRVKKYSKEKKCPRCGKINWRVVPLHEFGDPYLPSSINIFCRSCQYNEVVAQSSEDTAKAYARYVMKKDKEVIDGREFMVGDKTMADKLIKSKNIYGKKR